MIRIALAVTLAAAVLYHRWADRLEDRLLREAEANDLPYGGGAHS